METFKQPSIEAGWQSYLKRVVPKDAGHVQVNETRQAFWAGATVLFYAIMQTLDPGDEPTEDDLQRMVNIAAEIDAFAKTFDAEILHRQGATKQ